MEKATGLSGAVRVQRLTRSTLAKAEAHGRRLDATAQARKMNDELPISVTGLNLVELYERHVADVFVPKSDTKALHVIVQFPTKLVDSERPELMLHHAREFAKSVWGDAAIFGDRVDRDEKGKHIVDLFLAPKYQKKTKHTEKTAVATSKHLQDLAVAVGRWSPIKSKKAPLRVQGQALQDAVYSYFHEVMGLQSVQRGSAKKQPGDDWLSAEELEIERQERELTEKRNQLDNIRAAEIASIQQRMDSLTEREAATSDREAATVEAAKKVRQDQADLDQRWRQIRNIQKEKAQEAREREERIAAEEGELSRRQVELEAKTLGLTVRERDLATHEVHLAKQRAEIATDSENLRCAQRRVAGELERTAARNERLAKAEVELEKRLSGISDRETESAKLFQSANAKYQEVLHKEAIANQVRAQQLESGISLTERERKTLEIENNQSERDQSLSERQRTLSLIAQKQREEEDSLNKRQQAIANQERDNDTLSKALMAVAEGRIAHDELSRTDDQLNVDNAPIQLQKALQTNPNLRKKISGFAKTMQSTIIDFVLEETEKERKILQACIASYETAYDQLLKAKTAFLTLWKKLDLNYRKQLVQEDPGVSELLKSAKQNAQYPNTTSSTSPVTPEHAAWLQSQGFTR